MVHNWRHRESEEFRERAVRQAIMLGFSAEEYEIVLSADPNYTVKRWKYETPDGNERSGFASVYSAALEFLWLAKYPEHLIGRLNDGGQVSDA